MIISTMESIIVGFRPLYNNPDCMAIFIYVHCNVNIPVRSLMAYIDGVCAQMFCFFSYCGIGSVTSMMACVRIVIRVVAVVAMLLYV